jgi:hypothetical protein
MRGNPYCRRLLRYSRRLHTAFLLRQQDTRKRINHRKKDVPLAHPVQFLELQCIRILSIGGTNDDHTRMGRSRREA